MVTGRDEQPQRDDARKLVQALDSGEFGAAFCALWIDVPEAAESYLKRVGHELEKILLREGKRPPPSKFRNFLYAESRRFERSTGWRSKNEEFAKYFANWFAELASDIPEGKSGNPIKHSGRSSKDARILLNQALDALMKQEESALVEALLQPGVPGEPGRQGTPSRGARILRKIIRMGADHYGLQLSDAEIDSAIRDRRRTKNISAS